MKRSLPNISVRSGEGHKAQNNWASRPECHIKPDLLLVRQRNSDTFQNNAAWSRSELWG
ncbi:type II toxin-antitoxin system YafQ family toxin [Dyella sp. M7H15-1]|nr:type II toxin-antitoxin system YafQ family toxin [Dyella sp. M7H15-1]